VRGRGREKKMNGGGDDDGRSGMISSLSTPIETESENASFCEWSERERESGSLCVGRSGGRSDGRGVWRRRSGVGSESGSERNDGCDENHDHLGCCGGGGSPPVGRDDGHSPPMQAQGRPSAHTLPAASRCAHHATHHRRRDRSADRSGGGEEEHA
jgi:hypothetical protein